MLFFLLPSVVSRIIPELGRGAIIGARCVRFLFSMNRPFCGVGALLLTLRTAPHKNEDMEFGSIFHYYMSTTTAIFPVYRVIGVWQQESGSRGAAAVDNMQASGTLRLHTQHRLDAHTQIPGQAHAVRSLRDL